MKVIFNIIIATFTHIAISVQQFKIAPDGSDFNIGFYTFKVRWGKQEHALKP